MQPGEEQDKAATMSRAMEAGAEAGPDAAATAKPMAQARGLAGILFWVVAALAVLSMLLFVASAWPRMHFRYDVLDTGMLLEVQRLRSGLALYGPPTVEFTPFLYAPVYLYAAAAMSHLTGVTYESLRLVSTLATVGCFAMIYALVYAETRRWFAGLVAAGLFAAVYPVAMQWFDMGRVDMLYLLLVLAALYATRWWHPAFAAVLWVLAFQTKQGVLPIAVLALCHDWKRPAAGAGRTERICAAAVGIHAVDEPRNGRVVQLLPVPPGERVWLQQACGRAVFLPTTC